MVTEQVLINFIAAGVMFLLLTIPMYWIRHRVFLSEGVQSNSRGFCVVFALLFVVLWILIAAQTDNPLQAVLYAAFLGTLLWMAEIDIRTQLLPDSCNLFIFAIALVRQFLMPQGSILSGVLGCLVVSVPMFILCLFIGNAFGGGDIKLTFAWGFFLGVRLSLLAFFLAVLSGGIYGAYLLITGKKERKAQFAFGPFLCLGAILAVLWGDAMIAWYLGLVF